MITLDTSAVIAYLNETDEHHEAAIRVLSQVRGALIIPAPVMSEIAWMVETRHGTRQMLRFLDDVRHDLYEIDCCDRDLGRATTLMDRYADLPLGFADSSVMACAERRGRVVFTYDMRHFPIVAREGTFRIIGLD